MVLKDFYISKIAFDFLLVIISTYYVTKRYETSYFASDYRNKYSSDKYHFSEGQMFI
jgi:hypothetical protein